MRTRFLILGTLCSGLLFAAISQAQTTRPANSPDGADITMRQAVFSRELYPRDKYYGWAEGKGHELIQTREKPNEKETTAYTDNRQLCIRRYDETAGGFVTDTVTHFTDKNISCGTYVSRNEFGINEGIFWNANKTKVAFYVKDESKVGEFPLLDINTRTGVNVPIKYPMAGMDSERVDVMVYDLESGQTKAFDGQSLSKEAGWENPQECYLTNVCWAPDGESLYIQMLDRSQKHLMLVRWNSEGKSIILTEYNSKWVEPLEPLYFIKGCDNLFIYPTANRDGYRNLYLCDNVGNVRRLTAVDADVKYAGNDGRYLYYTSAEVSPVENHLFRVEMKKLSSGVKGARISAAQRLTPEAGWHQVRMSPDCEYFIDRYSSLCVPRVINLRKADGTLAENLLIAEDPTLDYRYGEITLGTVRSADGKYDNWYRLIKPAGFDPSKKYPLIVYVYGGPHSQMVRNTFAAELRNWEMYMAQRGYVVYVQDNRGTENRGLEFEQAIYGQCGQAEMADQMVGVRKLMEEPYIDKERIGVHGWSYGGFMTISLMTNYPDVFKVGVAGGPVIDWKWYEVMYGERYMDHPDKNPEGYAKTSLIAKVKDLKGKLLICQGVVDPVVVWQHSLSFISECISNNVQVDYFPYPTAEHNVMGKDRIHLMDKVTMYFDDYL